MKIAKYLVVVMVVCLSVIFSEQASAQLFRRFADDNSRDSNLSQLPGVNQAATRVADYGANQVSEEIRNEVNGRSQVRPAPDFNHDVPLASEAKQYRNPVAYHTQKPVVPGSGTGVQPPLFPYANRTTSFPCWLAPYEMALKQEGVTPTEDIAPKLEPEDTPVDMETSKHSATEKETEQAVEESVATSEPEPMPESEVEPKHAERVRLPALTFGTLLLGPLNIVLAVKNDLVR